MKQEHSDAERGHSLYERCDKVGKRPSFGELSDLLLHSAGTINTTFVVVDALGECDGKVLSTLLSEVRLL
jgi:hypothetical protein